MAKLTTELMQLANQYQSAAIALRTAAGAVLSLNGHGGSVPKLRAAIAMRAAAHPDTPKRRRHMSKAARARISAAQKLRWKKQKAAAAAR